MPLRDLVVAVLADAALLALAPVPARAQTRDPAADLLRIRQRLETPSPVRDTVETTAPPTFRTSVSEQAVDLRLFWGELDAVSPRVRPSGGPWHHEFVNMVTPDEFKGYGGIFTNGEKSALASQAMLSGLVFHYLPGAIAAAVKQARERAARTEVLLALEEFYLTHPGTRPAPAGERVP
jgi:hypothetical protein